MPKRIPYEQFCPIARTLDLVGDRWTLPVVRELHLGPLRYTDLHRALPGIGTDILADRLRRLATAGLIEHDRNGRYGLTAEGRSLGPVLREMLRWGGGRLDPDEVPDRPDPRLGVHAIVLNADPDPTRKPTTVELHVADLVCHVVLDADGAVGRMGEAGSPDATAVTDPRTLYALALGSVDISSAIAGGALAVTGDAEAVGALLIGVGMPESMRLRLAS
jgi:DNA-binding HxlR family transcriptional regulator